MRRRDCLLSEDKVYASLGILRRLLEGSDHVLFNVTVKATAQEAYLEAARAMITSIRQRPRLAGLAFVEPDGYRNLRGLPSWVPVLTSRIWIEPLGTHGTPFSAGVRKRSQPTHESCTHDNRPW